MLNRANSCKYLGTIDGGLNCNLQCETTFNKMNHKWLNSKYKLSKLNLRNKKHAVETKLCGCTS